MSDLPTDPIFNLARLKAHDLLARDALLLFALHNTPNPQHRTNKAFSQTLGEHPAFICQSMHRLARAAGRPVASKQHTKAAFCITRAGQKLLRYLQGPQIADDSSIPAGGELAAC